LWKKAFEKSTAVVIRKKIRKFQDHLVKCWLIQAVFFGNCAKEEEDSVQNFLNKLILSWFRLLGLGLVAN
jgi:hypothetical protein